MKRFSMGSSDDRFNPFGDGGRNPRRGGGENPLKSWQARLVLFAGSAAVSLGIAGLIGFFLLYTFTTPSRFDRDEIWTANQTFGITFRSSDGEPLARRGAYYADRVSIDDLPDYLVEAFIAIEDRRYYQHFGIDIRGLIRAAYVNATEGRTVQGGSTITQQTVKNLFLSSERTITRKVREMMLAIWLERHMSKQEVLELYLNRIYMGAGTYGVDAAARFYFDKPASQVSLAEAAMLAGLPKAPSRLAPTTNLQNAQNRADLVLRAMVDAGYLEKGDIFAARVAPAAPAAREDEAGLNYFVDYVSELVIELVGEPTENLTVTTTLDPALQAAADETLVTKVRAGITPLKVTEGALVTLDTGGAIRAMVGGKEYFRSQFNRAVQARRQPGSAFKPFLFLAALENGLEPDTVVEDSEVQIGTWSPDNYGGRFKGRMTIRQAFENSVNTVAVKLGQDIGTASVVEAAQRLGITSELVNAPSISLGTSEVTLLELTGAYLPFARGGLSATPFAILKIETEDGRVLYEHQGEPAERLMTKEHAQQMTHLMHHVMYRGTGKKAALEGRDAAGKTGTSQDWRDAWFVGYTANYVTGVWVGNDDDTSMDEVVGGALPAEIWREVMVQAHRGVPAQTLPGAFLAGPSREAQQLVSHLEAMAARFDLASRQQVVQGRGGADRRPNDDGWVSRTDEPTWRNDSEPQQKKRFPWSR